MNLVAKCNCCVHESVCKYQEVYAEGIEAILNADVSTESADGAMSFWKIKDCPHKHNL